MDFELRHLKAFLAVAEHGSFNRGAQALGLTQPAISKSIALLERMLQTPLFVRSARGARLTEAGTLVVRTAASMLALAAEARLELSARSQGFVGRLRIGATPSAMLGLVPLACARLGQTLGTIDLTIREGLDAELLPALEQGEIDILIGPISDIHAPPAHLEEGLLLEEGIAIGVRQGHPLATCATVKLQDIAHHGWILPSAGSRFHQLTETLFLSAALPWPRNAITTNSLAAQELLALNSDHILLCTKMQHIARSTALTVVPIEGSPNRRFGWRRMKSIKASLLLQAMIDQLETVIRDRNSLPALTLDL